MKTVILNIQHSLSAQQESLLGEFELFPVPSEGWTLPEMSSIVEILLQKTNIVFASPVPYLLAKTVYEKACSDYDLRPLKTRTIEILHNDKREKKELPGGKVIFTVAQDGWQLISVA